jgi:hypothetical protein
VIIILLVKDYYAPRYKLGNLTAILDWNGLQQFGWVLAINEPHRRDPWPGIDLRGMVAEILGEASPRRVIRFGIEDRWGESAPNDYLLDIFKMSPSRLSERIQKLVV